ncbi:hypothetical protein COOONC_06437 [Cooperia oncophora]
MIGPGRNEYRNMMVQVAVQQNQIPPKNPSKRLECYQERSSAKKALVSAHKADHEYRNSLS